MRASEWGIETSQFTSNCHTTRYSQSSDEKVKFNCKKVSSQQSHLQELQMAADEISRKIVRRPLKCRIIVPKIILWKKLHWKFEKISCGWKRKKAVPQLYNRECCVHFCSLTKLSQQIVQFQHDDWLLSKIGLIKALEGSINTLVGPLSLHFLDTISRSSILPKWWT